MRYYNDEFPLITQEAKDVEDIHWSSVAPLLIGPMVVVISSTILIRLFYDHDRAACIGHNS
jgi:hypothetical protein